jgi:hypothetical protein
MWEVYLPHTSTLICINGDPSAHERELKGLQEGECLNSDLKGTNIHTYTIHVD